MRNLLNLFTRYHFFFLFLLLETIAIVMVARNHQYQRSVVVHSANRLSGFFHGIHTSVSEYFALKQQNELLTAQNNRMLHQTPFSYLKTDRQVFVYRDTLYQQQYSYINARVINNSVNRRNNFLTLNKGRRHGIEPDLGVITPNGVVGIVKNVSQNFSSVISFLHRDTNISVRLKKNDHLGTLQWNGEDYRVATLLYIPTHVELSPGDTVITSGFSTIFPPDILIGSISHFEIQPGDNYFTVQVELAQDFNKLTYVHVVKNLFREEQEALEDLTP